MAFILIAEVDHKYYYFKFFVKRKLGCYEKHKKQRFGKILFNKLKRKIGIRGKKALTN
jgi:hypothetical protein